MNNYLEEDNEAMDIEESVDHTQYFVTCQGYWPGIRTLT